MGHSIVVVGKDQITLNHIRWQELSPRGGHRASLSALRGWCIWRPVYKTAIRLQREGWWEASQGPSFLLLFFLKPILSKISGETLNGILWTK